MANYDSGISPSLPNSAANDLQSIVGAINEALSQKTDLLRQQMHNNIDREISQYIDSSYRFVKQFAEIDDGLASSDANDVVMLPLVSVSRRFCNFYVQK